MRFSNETIDLILDIKEFSNGKLKNEFELSALIEYTNNDKSHVSFRDIIFKAKFLKGLARVIAVSTDSKENSEKFISEYTAELKKLTEMILSGLSGSNQIILDSFKKKFFELTPESLKSFNLLIEDLSICKDYFNDLRSNQ